MFKIFTNTASVILVILSIIAYNTDPSGSAIRQTAAYTSALYFALLAVITQLIAIYNKD